MSFLIQQTQFKNKRKKGKKKSFNFPVMLKARISLDNKCIIKGNQEHANTFHINLAVNSPNISYQI